MAKRMRGSSMLTWGQILSDVLLSILSHLSFVDVIRAKAVCSHWNSVAKRLELNTLLPRVPWLLITEESNASNNTNTKLFSIEQGQIYRIKNAASKDICDQSFCVGSSHGYMISFHIKRNTLSVFNPLTGTRTELPAMDTFLGSITDIMNDKGENLTEFVRDSTARFYWTRVFSRHPRVHFIEKAILSSDPAHDKSYGVVLICRVKSKIAFCQCRDSGAMLWLYLEGMDSPFHDIICHENKLYVLAYHCTLVIWDLGADSFPVRKKTIPFLVRGSLGDLVNVSGNHCISKFYLVESSGRVWLIVRCIKDFVDEEGRVLHEEDLLTDKAAEPLVCPYKILLFGLFRIDHEKKEWESMKSLDDQAVFVGGNHSASVSVCDLPGCEQNSVYFTDDYWERRLIKRFPYWIDGHDIGVYNLKDKSVKHFYQLDALKIQPPSCWFLPKP